MPSSGEGFGQASRKFWEERYGRPLSDEEIREINQNMTAFAEILLEWGRKEEAAKRHSGGGSESRQDSPPSPEERGKGVLP